MLERIARTSRGRRCARKRITCAFAPNLPTFARPALVCRAEEHASAVSLWNPFDLAALQCKLRRVIGLQRHPRQIAGASRREHGFGPVPDAELAQDALD